MKNQIRLTLGREIVAQLCTMAAGRGVSLSHSVNELLARIILRRRSFRTGRRRALDRLRFGLDLRWTPSLSRDDLHQR
jgi:hypothetical protein